MAAYEPGKYGRSNKTPVPAKNEVVEKATL